MKVSRCLVQTGAAISSHDLSEEEISRLAEKIQLPVRKLAHMTEYCILAVSLFLPLRFCGFRGIRLALLTAILCVLFASSDEFHQSFVAGRGPSVLDVLIDSIGALIGIGGMHLIFLK